MTIRRYIKRVTVAEAAEIRDQVGAAGALLEQMLVAGGALHQGEHETRQALLRIRNKILHAHQALINWEKR